MSTDRNPNSFPPEVRAFLEEVAEELMEQLAKKRKERRTIPQNKQDGEDSHESSWIFSSQ